MTEKLYYENAYTCSFSARVLSCSQGKHGFEVILDRSAFYPEGGGQPGDTGILGGVRVSDTHEKGGEIVHYCEKPLEAGAEVEGSIDCARRFDFMQQHSGEHIVSGLLHARFGCDNVGFHMGRDTVTIDFNCAITAEELREVENAANRIIWENRPMNVSWPDAETLAALPYRSKKELTGDVRIVECPGVDCCACCGTHVKSAGEIGLIKLLSVHPFRDGVRIEMLSGGRAYDYVNTAVDQNGAVGALLSAKADATAAAVKRLQEELAAANYRLVGLENRVFADIAAAYKGSSGDVLVFEEGLSADGVRRLADAIMAGCSGICAVFSGSDGEGYKYALGQRDGDLRAKVKEMNAALHGRGGGKPFFAQGSVQSTRAEIEEFFGSAH
ncbi:MAG: alanyl-tRNA editing protein [Oscillospiraceae bacterium]|nr:alanyl-tRNA editing protein [Oscillospiraceae bacterium]